MDNNIFSSPKWDVNDACEDLNSQLFGSSSYDVGMSNKKRKKEGLKMQKLQKKTHSPSNISKNISLPMNDQGNAKKALLTELKGKLASKRKIDDISNTKTVVSLSGADNIKKKKMVRFNIEEAVSNNDIGSTQQLPKKQSKNKKKDLKSLKVPVTGSGLKKLGNRVSNKSSLSSFLSKITKTKAQTEKSEMNTETLDEVDNSKFIAVKQSSKLKKKKKNTINELPVGMQVTSSPKQQTIKSSVAKKSKINADLVNGGSNSLTATILETKCSVASNKSVSMKPKQTVEQSQQQIKLNHNESKIPTRRRPGTLRERMMRQLQASRFRYLNEQMYCSKGSEALDYFKIDPVAFQAYHEGYRQQVMQWPLNPLDKIINSLKKKSSDLVIADFGCGDAKLSRSLPNIVHSFDLVAVTEEVTACDMAHTPLGNSSVDIAVFCLSLMGTNLADYLKEANRVLKVGGILKIAEVESRFENIDEFLKSLQKYGFAITSKDLSQNLFYFMDLKKVNKIKAKKKAPLPPLTLKPCLYKKR